MKNLILSLAVFLLSASAFANSEWTLDRCLQTAIGNSGRLQANRWSVTSAEANSDESRAEGLPSLALNGTYGYTSETMKLDIQSPVPGYSAPAVEFGDGNVYDYNLSARIPIYAGGVLQARTRAAESGYRATVFDAQADSLEFLHEVRQAFYVAAGANASLISSRNLSERLRRHHADIDSAKSAGLSTEEARVLSLSRLRQAQSQVVMREASARNARLQLGRFVGLEGVEIEPADSAENIPLIEMTEPVKDTRNLPELLAMDLRVKQGDQIVRSTRGSWLPSLGGNAAYHYAKPGVNALKNDWMDYYTLGLSASWTLWDFSARDYRIHSARANRNRLNSHREEIELALQTKILAAETSCQSARPARGMIGERVDLERQRLALVEGRWKAGVATETEYLDAQDDLTQAEFDLISATIALRLAENDLLHAYGR